MNTFFFFLLKYVDLNIIMTIFKFQTIVPFYSHSLGDGRWLFPGPSPISNPVSEVLETYVHTNIFKINVNFVDPELYCHKYNNIAEKKYYTISTTINKAPTLSHVVLSVPI